MRGSRGCEGAGCDVGARSCGPGVTCEGLPRRSPKGEGGCNQSLPGRISRVRPFANRLGERTTAIRHVPGAKVFWKVLRTSRFPDGAHGFHAEVLRDLQHLSRPVVVEALHAVHDETADRTLQRKVLPCRARDVGVGDRGLPGPLVDGLRDRRARAPTRARTRSGCSRRADRRRAANERCRGARRGCATAACWRRTAPIEPLRTAASARLRRSALLTSRAATIDRGTAAISDDPRSGRRCP